MRKVILIAFGKTNQALAEALEHATEQLRMGTPSENVTFDDRSHVSFDVYLSSDEEFCEITNEEPETTGGNS